MPPPSFLPNLLTASRLALLPLLWVAALRGMDVAVGVGMAVAWLTDALDGFLARRLRAATPLGSRLDSLADGLLFVSALAWLALLRPEFVRDRWHLPALWLALGLAAYAVGLLRFRRIPDLHLWSAKAANFFGFLFVAWYFTFGGYPEALFWVTMSVGVLGAAETLLAAATQRAPDEHRGTLLLPPRREPRA